jgi:hypothetical protein
VSYPRDPNGGTHDNPPGWTDPYADLTDLTGDEPIPQLEPASTPPATPPRSPLLTGLIIGLLLIALSVAVFQLLSGDDDESAATTTTTTTGEDGAETTTTSDGATTTTVAGTTVPPATDYPPIDPPIEVSRMKLMTDGMRINDNDIPDIVFTTDAATAIGRFTASFGAPDDDTGWQVSTGAWGVCTEDLERIVRYGPYAAILTIDNGVEIYNGYRQDAIFGGLDHVAIDLETLSGLKVGDTVGDLHDIYSSQVVTFATDPQLGTVFELSSSQTGELLLWGPVQGENDEDPVLGIYAPDVCGR